MKKSIAVVLFVLLGAAVSFAANRTFTGQIMDAPCAKMGNHDAGYKMTGTHTPKDCTLACMRAGAKLVLYNAKTKTVYQLDNQNESKSYAGENVKVIGTYNRSTRTIHVEKIEPAG